MIIPAQTDHLQLINDIYNQAVREGFCTAHTQPVDMAYRQRWFKQHLKDRFPVFVYQKDDKVLGWLSISAYRTDRQALNEVIEVSYYVDYDHHGQGIATRLMDRAVTFCKETAYRIMVAILVSENQPSIRLLENFGFKEGGRIPDAYRFRGEFRDHLYMFKRLDNFY